jgi:hypothetical protein
MLTEGVFKFGGRPITGQFFSAGELGLGLGMKLIPTHKNDPTD